LEFEVIPAAQENSAELEKNPGGNHPEPGYIVV
jgi:hypothetical protein